MPFLSVIIPVYNVEKYLRNCIDSVLNQNLTDFELILVDDGSPDNSGKICDEYAEKYAFVKVIHKENGGLSSARNEGIKNATGEYLIFMDSDDWWNEEVSVKEMLDTVKANPETQMFLFTSFDYIEGQGYFKRQEHQNLDKIKTDTTENYYQSLLDNGNLEVSAATKILKTEFIKNNDLYFKYGIRGEDNEWMMRLLRSLKNVAVINQPLYICRLGRMDSITNTVNLSHVKDMLSIIEGSLDYYKDNSNDQCLKEKELCFCSYLWFVSLGLNDRLARQDKKELKPLFKKTVEVCKYSNSKKTKLCYKVYKLFGLKMTSIILGVYLRKKKKKPVGKIKVKD